MLLLPVNKYEFHRTTRQIIPDHIALMPTNVYPSTIPGGYYQPVISISTVIPTSSNVMQDAMVSSQMVSSHQDTFQRVPQAYCGAIANTEKQTWSPIRSSSISPPQFTESRSILYDLLNKQDQHQSEWSNFSSSRTWHSADETSRYTPTSVKRLCVGLKNFNVTHKSATVVMQKIINFVQSLDSFKLLAIKDQELMFANAWVKLFMIGMAQDEVDFNTYQFQVSVTGSSDTTNYAHDMAPPSGNEATKADEAAKLKTFTQWCGELNLTAIEYAYIMGTVLFDPDVPGLVKREEIAALQMETLHALAGYHGQDTTDHRQQMRLSQILLGLPALKSIKKQAIIDLFFRPVLGSENGPF